MRFLRILQITEVVLIIVTLLSQIPFAVIVFTDKNYYFSNSLNQTILEIQQQAQRQYVKTFNLTSSATSCEEFRIINGISYCLTRFKTTESQIVKGNENCPSTHNFTQATFNRDTRKYCFSQPYTTTTCVQGLTPNCYSANQSSFPLQNITQNGQLVLNQFINSNGGNVNCKYLQNFFPNLISRTQNSYRTLDITLLVLWFLNLIPMFFQIATSVLYFVMKNSILRISMAIVKITTFISLLLQIGMGIVLIVISFHITSDSYSIRDYNQCFQGKYKAELSGFPFLQGRLMGGFKIFVILLTVIIILLAFLLVFMQMFRKAYKQSEYSMAQSSYHEMSDM